jgi:hypothetical protein
MPLANRAKRRTERESRQLVWQTAFAAARKNPGATQDELAGIIATDLQDKAGDGFDINLLLQLLITLMPFIMQLFQKK